MRQTTANARRARRVAPPLEHRILVTATLCLLAFGAVMVYSASSPQGVIESGGYGTGEFLTYLLAAGLGLIAMRVLERYGLRWLKDERLVQTMLGASFVLLLAVMVPGVGVDINDARRWFAAGPIQFQPSELMKFSLILYAARYLAENPRRLQRGFKPAVAPLAIAVVPACLLIAAEPDLGTTLVVFFTIVCLVTVAGMPGRYIGMILAAATFGGMMFVLAEPYELARLTSFLHPCTAACTTSNGYQALQGQIGIGSGGIFGGGLGKSLQALWLPEAQTDFILALVGEQLGLLGILGLITLYGMIAYAGLRTARRAPNRHTKLLASGLTSLILCQAIVNIFVVLGIAPLTGVPLPFISYAPTNLLVMLSSIGLLLGIARPATKELRLVDRRPQRRTAAAAGTEHEDSFVAYDNRDRSGRNGRPRGAGAGRGGRPAS